MPGVGLAGNRCLPNDLADLAKDYKTAYDLNEENVVTTHKATMIVQDSYQEVIQVHALLQDCCPGLFAHKSAEDAMQTIEGLDLLNGAGLPQRY